VRWRVICRRGHYALAALAALAIWLGWTASAGAESGTSTQPPAEATTGTTDTSPGSIATETEPPPDASPSSGDSPLPAPDDQAPPTNEAPPPGDQAPPTDEAPPPGDQAPPTDEAPPPVEPPPFESPPPPDTSSSSSPSTSFGGPAPGVGFEASSEPLGVLSTPSLVSVASDASAPVTHVPIRLVQQTARVVKAPASQHGTATPTPPRHLLPLGRDSASGSIAGGGATGGSSGGASAGLAVALVGLLALAAACLGGIVPVGGQPPVGTRLILKTERPG
jgi:hypothetical protein